MTNTPIFAIPEVAASQSQPEVVVNRAFRILEAMAQISIISDTLTAPPGSPTDGDTYIVAATATGAWAGKEAKITVYAGGTWLFVTPRDGFTAWVSSAQAYKRYDATSPAAWRLGSVSLPEGLAPQSIISDALTAPPGSPADGDAYIVAATATGAWTGQEKKIAIRLAAAWQFLTPRDGFTVWCISATAYKRWDLGTVAWVAGPT